MAMEFDSPTPFPIWQMYLTYWKVSFTLVGMNERTHHEQHITNLYLREFLPAVVGYGVALAIVIPILNADDVGDWRYLVALLPVIPILWGIRAIVRNLRRSDEMQRQVILIGFAVGFALTIIASSTLAFLAIAGLNTDPWGMWVVFSAGGLGWIVGSTAAAGALQ